MGDAPVVPGDKYLVFWYSYILLVVDVLINKGDSARIFLKRLAYFICVMYVVTSQVLIGLGCYNSVAVHFSFGCSSLFSYTVADLTRAGGSWYSFWYVLWLL